MNERNKPKPDSARAPEVPPQCPDVQDDERGTDDEDRISDRCDEPSNADPGVERDAGDDVSPAPRDELDLGDRGPGDATSDEPKPTVEAAPELQPEEASKGDEAAPASDVVAEAAPAVEKVAPAPAVEAESAPAVEEDAAPPSVEEDAASPGVEAESALAVEEDAPPPAVEEALPAPVVEEAVPAPVVEAQAAAPDDDDAAGDEQGAPASRYIHTVGDEPPDSAGGSDVRAVDASDTSPHQPGEEIGRDLDDPPSTGREGSSMSKSRRGRGTRKARRPWQDIVGISVIGVASLIVGLTEWSPVRRLIERARGVEEQTLPASNPDARALYGDMHVPLRSREASAPTVTLTSVEQLDDTRVFSCARESVNVSAAEKPFTLPPLFFLTTTDGSTWFSVEDKVIIIASRSAPLSTSSTYIIKKLKDPAGLSEHLATLGLDFESNVRLIDPTGDKALIRRIRADLFVTINLALGSNSCTGLRRARGLLDKHGGVLRVSASDKSKKGAQLDGKLRRLRCPSSSPNRTR